jgi:hypothetical protein
MQGDVESHGKKAPTLLSRCFRFDLASSQARVYFLPADNATRLSRYGPSLPFHNLWIPLQKKSPESREHHGICGCVLQDKTAKRLMNFYEVMLTTVPVVCGCFIRDCVSFPNSYVTLSVSERVTRECPVVFEDAPDGSNNVIVKIRNVPIYYINLDKRESYSGINWVSLNTLS